MADLTEFARTSHTPIYDSGHKYESPEADVAREPSLEDDLNLLDNQLGEMANIIEQINSTKRRIDAKNNHLGQRIGKSYEAFQLISRGEIGMNAPEAVMNKGW